MDARVNSVWVCGGIGELLRGTVHPESLGERKKDCFIKHGLPV